MDIISNSSMAATPPAAFVQLPAPKTQAKRPQTTTTETQTADPQAAQQTRTHTPQQHPAITDLPMATAPSTQPYRASLPSPTKREIADDIAEGSAPKQHRTAEQQTAPQRPEETAEPPTTRMRVSAVKVKTKKGETIKAVSNEDEEEIATEKILLEPWVTNTEGLDKEQTIEGGQ